MLFTKNSEDVKLDVTLESIQACSVEMQNGFVYEVA